MGTRTEEQVRDWMRARTADLMPGPGLLAAARRRGIRRRRRIQAAAAGAVVLVVAAGGLVGWTLTQQPRHQVKAAAPIPQRAVVPPPAASAAATDSWSGWRQRIGAKDAKWPSGRALTVKLRSLDYGPRTSESKLLSTWYVYGTINHRDIVVSNIGSQIYASLLTSRDQPMVTPVGVFDQWRASPVAARLPSMGGSGVQWLIAMPAAKLSYRIKDSPWVSAGAGAALISLKATEARASVGTRTTTVVLSK